MKQVAGFVMIPVVITISLMAVSAFLLNLEGVAQLKRTETRGEAEQAGYVAEAGLNHALWRVDEASCGPYNALSSTNFGNHSYQATVTTEGGGALTHHSVPIDQETWRSRKQFLRRLESNLGRIDTRLACYPYPPRFWQSPRPPCQSLYRGGYG